MHGQHERGRPDALMHGDQRKRDEMNPYLDVDPHTVKKVIYKSHSFILEHFFDSR